MVRVAELMEVPGICFVDGVDPGPEIIELATENHTLLMVSAVEYSRPAASFINSSSPTLEAGAGVTTWNSCPTT